MEQEDFKNLTVVTELSCENGKSYFLYSDVNLYEKSEDETNECEITPPNSNDSSKSHCQIQNISSPRILEFDCGIAGFA